MRFRATITADRISDSSQEIVAEGKFLWKIHELHVSLNII